MHEMNVNTVRDVNVLNYSKVDTYTNIICRLQRCPWKPSYRSQSFKGCSLKATLFSGVK